MTAYYETMVLKNPRNIPTSCMPLIVFSDHTSGLIEWAIKMRTKGLYNHVMLAMKQGHFVSQGNTYSEIDMKRYLGRRNRLLFIEIIGLTQDQREAMNKSVTERLRLPWWRKAYDWVGIVGQAIGIKKLQLKGLNYCSQDVYLHLSKIEPKDDQQPLQLALAQFNPNGSPQDHHDVIMKHPGAFRVYGLWQGDL
jgi:hypothetical protein